MRVKNIDETKKIVRDFYEEILKKYNDKENRKALVILLSGDLGAGKTTFTKEFGRIIGIKENINSPTFVISKQYNIVNNSKIIWKKMIHIDAYRLERKDDLKLIGLEDDLKNNQNIILIEWPEKIEKWLIDLIDDGIYRKVVLRYLSFEEREILF